MDLVQLLRRNAADHPDRIAVRAAGQPELTWSQVDSRAQAVAGSLAKFTAPGDRVALLFGADADFVPALFGCWYAGVVAVPIAPGRTGRRAAEHSGATMIVTSDQLVGFGDRGITVDQAVETGLTSAADRAGHELALVQYTSGSTGAPKGVLVSHDNYLHNLRMLDEFVRSVGPRVETAQVVSWLPVFHDMGLALLLFAAWRAGTATMISPLHFLKDPGVWLRTISETGGQITAAPNFAFDLCARRVSQQEAAGLDLRSMAVVLNAAEPVRAETLTRFTEHFRLAGFDPDALAPCFGMAEATVFVSGLRYGGPPRVVRFDRRALQTGAAVEQPDTGPEVVSCGIVAPGLTARIVDPATHVERGPGGIGEIWLHGPNVARGYEKDDTTTVYGARISGFDGQDYFRTGDLGFLHHGELFVTGRLADVIEVDGRFLHPEDVEFTIEGCHPALRGRRCAVVPNGPALDRLAVAAEVRLALPVDAVLRAEIESAIRSAVRDRHDVEITEIVLVPTGSIPVTTSGKVRRLRARALFAATDG
ncbi:fatty acyl-AMP ligase [Actinoplanes derwentensis]|uniref:Acyl-CoA synthetase (AMP-forming)/AMP-acid ligase II n=1 Tax=Actinoplanes derwentensis TaxID=113562 RepID=A0A1H1XPK5_9ACTN|nr:fatty acyl-AMP ligase [Actinoplanes derwentensis]GID87711.1 acyl-CoA synthetase [Actinoplanes derwentensis]SDT10716.1 Acyl-CoA synthetase (AMP-forming)/AMP-acid ligase II [Actinoplanes derwentensis]